MMDALQTRMLVILKCFKKEYENSTFNEMCESDCSNYKVCLGLKNVIEYYKSK